jgi:hypothetical protein
MPVQADEKCGYSRCRWPGGSCIMRFVYKPREWEDGHEGVDITRNRHHVILDRRKH